MSRPFHFYKLLDKLSQVEWEKQLCRGITVAFNSVFNSTYFDVNVEYALVSRKKEEYLIPLAKNYRIWMLCTGEYRIHAKSKISQNNFNSYQTAPSLRNAKQGIY